MSCTISRCDDCGVRSNIVEDPLKSIPAVSVTSTSRAFIGKLVEQRVEVASSVLFESQNQAWG
jgi:hypothetical protein